MGAFQVDEESIFDVARRISDEAAQADYLQQACGDNVELRERIKGMLKVDAVGDSFFESPPPGIDATIDIPRLTEKPGDTFGPYKLLQKIGEGGFGVVYLAEQISPVRRKVALKIIKPGMDTKEVIGRFEAERQALALMDHPNIAKVFDAGATAAGRPYFVMELVKGIPLVQFCDENKMSTRQRLELFISVCHAIQHAHQKGIIHRDLKPSNVMVTIHDNKPVPKVIDFGVSKAISQQLTERTLFTAYGQMVGTPVYMSPEQAQMSGLDIDTRSDIYSLGVMLFELLTGSTPLDAEHLRKSGYAEMQRLIREEDAPKPSDRLSTQQGEALTKIAKHRGTEPSQLNRQVRGDVDWIVMKALEKDRNRRYETANGFLADIERYLNNESVLACPPTTSYRLRKFISRNRQAVLVASSIATALLLAIVGLSVGYLQAQHSAKEARLAWNNVSQEQERTAKERDRAELQRRLAIKKSEQLDEKNAEIDRNLYAAQMAVAVQTLERPDGIGRVKDLTDNWLPQPGQDDLRGWEWYYLRSEFGKEWKNFSNDKGFVFWTTEGIRMLKPNLDDGLLTICNADTGDVLVALPGGSVELDPSSSSDANWWASRLSQDGNCLALEHSDGTIRIWDLQTGRLANTLPMQGKTMAWFGLSSDGALIATVNHVGNVTILECQTGNPLARIATDQLRMVNESWVPHLYWSPDGSRIAVKRTGSEKVYVFGTSADQDLKLTIPDVPPKSILAWRPDSKVLAIAKAAGDDKQIQLFNADTGVELNSFDIGHQRFAFSLAWDPDGRRIATGSHDKTVRLWDPETGQRLATFRGHTVEIKGLSWSPDSAYLISHAADGVKIWDSNTKTQACTSITEVGRVFSLKWSPDSARLAWDCQDGIHLWDVPQEKAIAFLPEARSVWSGSAFAWSPDGSNVAYNSHDNTIPIWSSKTDEVIGSMAGHDGQLTSLSWISEKIATGGSDQVVKLWDAKTFELVDEHHLHQGKVNTVALSRKGDFLASGGDDKMLCIWDVKQKESVLSQRYDKRVSQVAWSPVDERVAVAIGEEVVYVLDMQAGQKQLKLIGHTNNIGHIAWSPDGARIASGGKDRTLKVWDSESGQELISFDLERPMKSLDWSPDGQKIAVGFFDRDKIMIWDASHGYDLERLRARSEESFKR